jgi:hypothetical protein
MHVDRDALSAKFWLEPVELARNLGFPPKELRVLRDIILKNKQNFLEEWYGYFGIGG